MKSPTRGCAALVLAFAACGGDRPVDRGQPAPPREVQLVTATREPLPRTLAVSGVLAAQQELTLALQVGGRLQDLPIDTGDLVEQGALVARLDPADFELERARAEAALLTAHARLGLTAADDLHAVDPEATAPVREAQAVLAEAKLQRDRLAEMVQEQLRPPAELETADATLLVAQSRLQRAREDGQALVAEAARARVELAQAQKRLHDSEVLAPWRGRIAVRHATAGEVLAAGAPVAVLVRLDPLRLRLMVPERPAAEVAIGQRVQFTVDGLGGEQREGFVTRLGAVVERSNRTRLCEATVDNPDGALLPGAFCRAEIVVQPAEQVLLVPRKAVVTFAGVARVFTVATAPGQPTRAEGHVVQLGRELGERWQILGGIDAGAELVADPGDLRHGDAVVVAR
jgi:RND family efflux transporter MFP subunit